jgi:dipeptidyl aminopeptidase/acylaminoacyl peptidase
VPKYPSDWSRDGRYLVYASLDPKTKADLWVLRDPGATGEHTPQPFLRSEFNESHGQVSPDGKYLAYQSDETGRFEIYVRPFPSGTGGKWQISSSGGGSPRWRRDGKELFYLAPDRRLMAVEVSTGSAFGSKMPKPLFETRIFGNYASAGYFTWRYAVAADGKRFVVLNTGESAAVPIIVVLNWAAGSRP